MTTTSARQSNSSLAVVGLAAAATIVSLTVAIKKNKEAKRKAGTPPSGQSSSSAPPPPPEGCSLDSFVSRYIKADHQRECNDAYGNIFTVKNPMPGLIPNQVWINDPAVVRYLCVKCANMYRPPSTFQTRGLAFQKATQSVVGVGVTGLVGDEWRWRKNALIKSFHKSKMFADERGLINKVVQEGHKLCIALAEAADQDAVVAVDLLTTQAAVGVVLYFLFGRDLDFDANDLRDAAGMLMECLAYYLFNPTFSLFKHVPGTTSYRMNQQRIKAWKTTDTVFEKEIQRLIDEYNGVVEVHPDRKPGSVLATLIEEEPRFREGGVQSMIAEGRVFVQAGFETTAHSLAFAMGMMAERPDLAKDMATLGTAFLHDGKDMSYSENTEITSETMKQALEETTLVRNFFMESLRLYPLAPSLGGECTEDIVIQTSSANERYTLAKGTNCFFPNMLLQRQVPDPDTIDPARWDVSTKDQEPFLHTFQNGAHTCPGKPLSMLEGHVFLLMVATYFEFEFPTEEMNKVEYEDNLLLRPKNGMQLRVKRRAVRRVQRER